MSGATCAIFIMSFAPAADTSPCSAAKFHYARITLTAARLFIALIKELLRSPGGPGGRRVGNQSCLDFGVTPDQDPTILPKCTE